MALLKAGAASYWCIPIEAGPPALQRTAAMLLLQLLEDVVCNKAEHHLRVHSMLSDYSYVIRQMKDKNYGK